MSAEALTTPSVPATDPVETPRPGPPWAKLVAVVLGLTAAVSLMVLAFLTPSINSGAHELPLAVSGPEQVTDPLQSQLDEAMPDAFETTRHGSADEVAESVLDREAIGGLSFDADGNLEITLAGGAGTPYTSLLQSVGNSYEAQGVTVTYTDVAPLTEDDPTGAGIGALALPMAFGGMISAVLLSTVLKKHPLMKLGGALVASIAVGFAVTTLLQFGFDAVDGTYVLTALSLALGTAAISLFVLGLESLFGFAGLGVGSVLIMFLGNPLSGIGTGWQWLPSPWGMIGQLLPLGSAGTLMRSMAFFDGHGATFPIVVLVCWVVAGAGLLGASMVRGPGRRRSETPAAV